MSKDPYSDICVLRRKYDDPFVYAGGLFVRFLRDVDAELAYHCDDCREHNARVLCHECKNRHLRSTVSRLIEEALGAEEKVR